MPLIASNKAHSPSKASGTRFWMEDADTGKPVLCHLHYEAMADRAEKTGLPVAEVFAVYEMEILAVASDKYDLKPPAPGEQLQITGGEFRANPPDH